MGKTVFIYGFLDFPCFAVWAWYISQKTYDKDCLSLAFNLGLLEKLRNVNHCVNLRVIGLLLFEQGVVIHVGGEDFFVQVLLDFVLHDLIHFVAELGDVCLGHLDFAGHRR